MRRTVSTWRTMRTSTWKDASVPCKKMACHPPPPPPVRTTPALAKVTGWMRIHQHDRWRLQPFRSVRNMRRPPQTRSSRPMKQVKKSQRHNPRISILSMKLWLKDTHLRLLAIPGANRHLVTASIKPPLVVGHVGMIRLCIRSAIRRIRLSPPRRP